MGFKEKNVSETNVNVGSIVGEKSVIEGNFSTSESTRVDGEIKGNVTCKSKLYVGVKGKVIGNIVTESIMVSGEVKGDIISNSKVEISSSGKVNGNVQAKVLVIDENAIFNGNCNMTGTTKVEPTHKENAKEVSKLVSQESAV